MGRIAEALKKAEQERGERLRRTPPTPPTLLTEDPIVSPPIAEQHAVQPSTIAPAAPTPTSRRRESLIPGPALITPWNPDPRIVSVTDRQSQIAEQYRSIRTWLLRRSAQNGRCAIAITSSLPGEGKSVTTANLGVVFAEIRHLQVLVVDANLRHGQLGQLLGIETRYGLSDLINETASLHDAIVPTAEPNLHFLSAGSTEVLEPTSLFSSPAASRAFETFRERYHVVLVDTPPVQHLTDVGIIGGLCSAIAVVVRMHQTPSQTVRESVRWLQGQQLPVVGCIAVGCSDSEHSIDDVISNPSDGR